MIFVNRFHVAFVLPGCSASVFFSFVQSLDYPMETYIFEKASLAQAAGISFRDAYALVVQGLHDVFAPVELAPSHHPSTGVVAPVADVQRAARITGIDSERRPREIISLGRPSVFADPYYAPGPSRFTQSMTGARLPESRHSGRAYPGRQSKSIRQSKRNSKL